MGKQKFVKEKFIKASICGVGADNNQKLKEKLMVSIQTDYLSGDNKHDSFQGLFSTFYPTKEQII